MYKSKDNNFFKFKDTLELKNVDFTKFPTFNPIENHNNVWEVEYCNSSTLNDVIDYTQFESDIEKYLNKSTDFLNDQSCTKFSTFMSGISEYYKYDMNLTNINDDQLFDETKKELKEIIGYELIFIKKIIIQLKSYILSKAGPYLIIVTKYDNSTIYFWMWQFTNETFNISDINSQKLYYKNTNGYNVANSKKLNILFFIIEKMIKNNGTNISISPLGFFHIHLGYNRNLKQFFGVVHAKYEISSEINHNRPSNYMKQSIQYKAHPETYVDLTQGTKEENVIEHNYLFNINRKDKFKLYKFNCFKNNFVSGIALSDSFLNAKKFAEINYYGNLQIKNKINYTYICKSTDTLNAGVNEKNNYNLFPFCQQQTVQQGPSQDEIDLRIKYGNKPNFDNLLEQYNMYLSITDKNSAEEWAFQN